MNKSVRIPKQKRSIEKKQKIINVAQRLFNEKGYYSVNTTEIAKEAELSVCSVYSYFKDKKDIFITCLKSSSEKINNQICERISEMAVDGDIYETAKSVYQVFIASHKFSNIYHNDTMSLKYVDEDIRDYFEKERLSFSEATINQLKKVGIRFIHEKEGTILIYSLFQSLEDEMIYNQNTEIDKNILIDECAKMITAMLTKE